MSLSKFYCYYPFLRPDAATLNFSPIRTVATVHDDFMGIVFSFLSFFFSFFFLFNPKPKSLRYFDETPAGNKRERLEKVTREVVSGIIVGSLYGRNPYPPLLFHISIEIQTNILFSYVKISFKLKTISNFRNFRFEKETKKKEKNISDTNYYPTGATFYARNNGRGSNAYT